MCASPVHRRDDDGGGSPDSAQRGCEGRDVRRVVGDLERVGEERVWGDDLKRVGEERVWGDGVALRVGRWRSWTAVYATSLAMQRSYSAAATSATSSAAFQFIETAWTRQPSEGAASCVRPAACSALASCSTSFARESLSVTRLATPDQGEAQAQEG